MLQLLAVNTTTARSDAGWQWRLPVADICDAWKVLGFVSFGNGWLMMWFLVLCWPAGHAAMACHFIGCWEIFART
jgi:hypothetical protein